MRDGTLFEFSSAGELLAAAEAARGLGVVELESYSPFAVEGLDAKLGIRRTRIPRAVFIAAVLGCAVAVLILWGTNAYDYPLDVGGRPLSSLPADVPIAFETTVLFGSATAFVLVFARSGLPRLHHPVFEIDGIASSTRDRFWLGVGRSEATPDVRARLAALGALSVREMRGGRGAREETV